MKTCEEYRVAIAADPSGADVDAHTSRCADCRTFRDEMLALDGKISAAMTIPVPALRMPTLEQIDSSVVTTLGSRRLAAPAWFALAASVVMVAMLGLRMFGDEPSHPSLADEILAHIEHEPYAVRVSDKAVSDERLARVVPSAIARVDHSNGLITYAQSCVINGTSVPHLVIQGERGPVTILLMPEQEIDGPQSIDGEFVNGVILPVGSGSIAIVGEKDEDLRRIEDGLKNSLMWST